MKAILLDIDHTVSDAFWRDDMIAMGDWNAYHAAATYDGPVVDIVDLLETLNNFYRIIGLTARPEKWRKKTMEWLLKHNVHIDELLMRPDNDYRRAPELKVALAIGLFGDKLTEEVAFMMDDREDVVAAFKAIGVTALQVHARRGGGPQ